MRRRPTSHLFPYTTLFRSNQARKVRLEKPNAGPVSSGGDRKVSIRAHVAHGPSKPTGERSNTRRPRIARDRKSTRLNSSHLGISYAVFCLKKKNLHKKETA